MAAITGTTGNDNGVDNPALNGTLDNDSIRGLAGDDNIFGLNGNDLLRGGMGVDIVEGGLGNDIIQVGEGELVDVLGVFEILDGGADTDQIQIVGSASDVELRQSIVSIEVLSFAKIAPGTSTIVHINPGAFDDLAFAHNLTVVGRKGAEQVIEIGAELVSAGGVGDYDASGLGFINWTAGEDKLVFDGFGTDPLRMIGSSAADEFNTLQNNTAAGSTIGGLAGNDIISVDGDQKGSIFDGGLGFDSLLIAQDSTSSSSTDLTEASLTSIEAIKFKDQAAVGIMASQIGGTHLSSNLRVVGLAPDQTVIGITMGTVAKLDLSHWTFANFGEQSGIGFICDGSAETIVGSSVRDFIQADRGNDTINGGRGKDFLFGGEGNDVIIGGADADSLAGGVGNDRFVYASITASGVADEGRDTISDFAAGDKIDVSAIDANRLLPGNQAFRIDTNNIPTAGEIVITAVGTDSVVNFFLQNNRHASMALDVDGKVLTGGDFVL